VGGGNGRCHRNKRFVSKGDNGKDPIDEILDTCVMNGPWEPRLATWLANRIYATQDVVIRVAKEHVEALRDARTESIAAPIAHKTGLSTPRIHVYDESRNSWIDVIQFGSEFMVRR